jgi:FkbM family methyltransferase
MYPQSEIIGFEPDNKTFAVLKENLEKNKFKKITLINAAISTKNGKITFYYSYNEDAQQTRSVGNSIFETEFRNKKTTVSTVNLSKYIKEKIDIIKMDIEGIESNVIQRNLPYLKNIHYLVLEFHAYQKLGDKNSLGGLLTALEKAQFSYMISEAEGQGEISIHNHLLILKAVNRIYS